MSVEAAAAAPIRRRGGVSGENKIDPTVVLDAAAELFADRGYRATSLGHVASRIGVTRQALYYHFPRKHDILLALFDRMTRLLNEGADAVDASDLPPGPRFTALVENHGRVVAENIFLATILLGEDAEIPEEERKSVRKKRVAYTDRLIAAFTDGVQAGVLRRMDAKLAVYTIIGAQNGMFRWYSEKGSLKPTEVAQFTTDLLRSGYETAPQSAEGNEPSGRSRRQG